MTQAPPDDRARPGAILSRLLFVLAFVLFGAPQAQVERAAPLAGPAAQSEVAQAPGIISVQRHLLRAQPAPDTSPDAMLPGVATPAVPPSAAALAPAPRTSFVPAAIRILPPVRGPPAA
ncbi:hypothetical protein [Rhodovulum strictum]|uniref:Uncharacterized protein n=1 Tax=Rhodovulum strictum TaxID=58314 RepID=A0A844B4R1_9RHOB|nr:hypothetical protein [Rhodovulum strictum]MRH21346.1 hypothetical protein [Rhodovulum strictum]